MVRQEEAGEGCQGKEDETGVSETRRWEHCGSRGGIVFPDSLERPGECLLLEKNSGCRKTGGGATS